MRWLVSPPWSTQQTWTIIQHDGPDHLGILVNLIFFHHHGPFHLGFCCRVGLRRSRGLRPGALQTLPVAPPLPFCHRLMPLLAVLAADRRDPRPARSGRRVAGGRELPAVPGRAARPTVSHCVHAVPSCCAFILCLHAVPSCCAFILCLHVVPSCCAFMLCRHVVLLLY